MTKTVVNKLVAAAGGAIIGVGATLLATKMRKDAKEIVEVASDEAPVITEAVREIKPAVNKAATTATKAADSNTK